MTVVIGVDPSSAKLAAIVSIIGDEPNVETRTLKLPTHKPTACAMAFEWIRGLVDLASDLEPGSVHVFLELPVMGRGGPGSTIPQARINGALAAGAELAGATVTDVNNAHCKKVVLGKGNASKDEIKEWVSDAWPTLYKRISKDQDLCDSAMIYVYGRKTLLRKARVAERRASGNMTVKRPTPKRKARR